MSFSKPMPALRNVPTFNGKKHSYLQFRQEFILFLDSFQASIIKGMGSILLCHDKFMMEMARHKYAISNTQPQPAPNDPTWVHQRKIDLETYHNLLRDRDSASIRVRAELQASMSEEVYNSIYPDIQTLVAKYSHKKENFFKFTHYPLLRATWQALEQNFTPNISDALAKERLTLENLSRNSSIANIFHAINHYVHRTSLYPVLDANKQQVVEKGKLVYEKVDTRQLKDILVRHIENSCDLNKHTLLCNWITHGAEYESMYEDIKAYVRSASESEDGGHHFSVQAQIAPTRPTTTIASPTVPALTANATFNNLHDSAPLKYTHGIECSNCHRFDHYASDCTSTRCESCNINFPSYLDRIRHAMDQHRKRPPFQQRPQHNSYRNNHNSYRSNSNHNHRDRSRSKDRHSRSHSRDRSRSRDRSNNNRPRDHYSKSPHRQGSSSSSSSSHNNQANSAINYKS